MRIIAENVIKVIGNVHFWPKGISVLHYYILHFTEDKIIWEFIDKNPTPPIIYHPGTWLFLPFLLLAHKLKEKKVKATTEYEIEFGEKMTAEQILENKMENFKTEYNQIENVEIKKGKFKITFMRDYPLLKKEHTFHFDRKDQQDVESIFMKLLSQKTLVKS